MDFNPISCSMNTFFIDKVQIVIKKNILRVHFTKGVTSKLEFLCSASKHNYTALVISTNIFKQLKLADPWSYTIPINFKPVTSTACIFSFNYTCSYTPVKALVK